MKFLELKIPPGFVVLFFGVAIWAVSVLFPSLNLSYTFKYWLSGFFAIAGTLIVLAGLIEFQQAKTTINPVKPKLASSFVHSGIYRFTRNPMYFGMLLILAAFAFRSSNILSPLFLIGFIIYMNRFQIIPEEKVLTKKFGNDYADFKQSVRRWI